MIFEFISPRKRRGMAILVGRREGIKGGERDFSRSRVNHGLLSSPTVGLCVQGIFRVISGFAYPFSGFRKVKLSRSLESYKVTNNNYDSGFWIQKSK
jgi:hypothetical protein